MTAAVSHVSSRVDRFDEIGAPPWSLHPPARFGGSSRRLPGAFGSLISSALYYGLRLASGVMDRDHDFIRGMHPEFWTGDVTVRSPIGSFACRARTIDFDIVNPNYEAIEVDCFRQRILRAAKAGGNVVCLDVGAHIGKFGVLAGRLLQEAGGRGRSWRSNPSPAISQVCGGT